MEDIMERLGDAKVTMVLWVASHSLRLEDRWAASLFLFRGLALRGKDPTLDRSCFLALPGGLRLLLKS